MFLFASSSLLISDQKKLTLLCSFIDLNVVLGQKMVVVSRVKIYQNMLIDTLELAR